MATAIDPHMHMDCPPVDADRVVIAGVLLGTLAGLGVPVLLQLSVGHQVLVGLEERGMGGGGYGREGGDTVIQSNGKTDHLLNT